MDKKYKIIVIVIIALIVNVKSVEANIIIDGEEWHDSETWDKTCVYGGTGGEVTVYIKPGKSMIIYQANISDENNAIIIYNGSYVKKYGSFLYYIIRNDIVVNDNKCPVIIYVTDEIYIPLEPSTNIITQYIVNYSMTDNGGDPYVLKGNSEGMSDIDNSGEETCEGVINTKARNLINKYLGYIHIIVPIMVLALGVFDFFKAAISSKEEEMKKAQNRFIIRLVTGVLVFLAPTIVNIIISILNNGACPIN